MPTPFVFGQKVGANLGGADLVGFVVDEPYKNSAGETKYKIQIGSEIHAGFTYREKSDRDSAGAGLTFWIGDVA